MSSKLTKIINIILWVLMGISIVLVVLFYFGKIVPGTEGTNMEEPAITEIFLKWTYVMAIGATIAVLGFSIMNLIANPKSLKQSLIMVVAGAVLVVIAYFLADDQVLSMPGYEGTQNISGTLKFAGTFLWLAYILAVLAALSILYSETAKYFK